jgi:hypothetical protein
MLATGKNMNGIEEELGYSQVRHKFPLTPALKKLQPAAARCRHQITEVDQTRILLKIILEMKNNKHFFIVL